MYGIYAYIGVVWGGIYGSPMECLGKTMLVRNRWLESQGTHSCVSRRMVCPPWRTTTGAAAGSVRLPEVHFFRFHVSLVY